MAKDYDITKYEFYECATCAAKSGSPILCESCLLNRWAISNLKRLIELERSWLYRLVGKHLRKINDNNC